MRGRCIVRVALAISAALAAPGAASAFTLTVTGPPAAPEMVLPGQIQRVSVCLPVTNPAMGRSVLFGQRFTDGPVSATTPAIVLVHGIASSTENWDFSPTWSVARALASAGYVVYSYDRLGYAKSGYFDHPAGGYTLTTQAHRAMLHDVVGDVKSGSYGISASGDCRDATPGDIRSQRVVIIGHSAGGWIVAGYPGQYHDVAAMIETDISGSAGGGGAGPLGGSSSGGSFTPDPGHPDYFQFFQKTQDCLDFNTYTPGSVQYVVNIACAPPFLDSPFGEIADLGAMYAQNDAAIAMIGPTIPVLLTSGEKDTTDPPASAKADLAYYKAHCGCDVTQILYANTAHLFMVHRSLATWVDDVVGWLSAHHIGAAPPGGGGGGGGRAGCPAPRGRLTGRALGPLRLGFTRAHARRVLPRFTVTRRRLDTFCLRGERGIRVGYVHRRAALILTANRAYRLRGVRPGTRQRRVKRRLHLGTPIRIGAVRWYLVRLPRGEGVLKVRRGAVAEVGVVNRRLVPGPGRSRRFLRSFTAA